MHVYAHVYTHVYTHVCTCVYMHRHAHVYVRVRMLIRGNHPFFSLRLPHMSAHKSTGMSGHIDPHVRIGFHIHGSYKCLHTRTRKNSALSPLLHRCPGRYMSTHSSFWFFAPGRNVGYGALVWGMCIGINVPKNRIVQTPVYRRARGYAFFFLDQGEKITISDIAHLRTMHILCACLCSFRTSMHTSIHMSLRMYTCRYMCTPVCTGSISQSWRL